MASRLSRIGARLRPATRRWLMRWHLPPPVRPSWRLLPLDEALPAVAEAARQGMEQTKEMVASIGKAKTLGERSLGHADPGALSTYLILKVHG